MANPTFDAIFGIESENVGLALTTLGITDSITDARLAAQKLIELLHTNYAVLVDGTTNLSTYSVLKEADNIDIDTQRQIFTFTFDMKIAATTVEDEPA